MLLLCGRVSLQKYWGLLSTLLLCGRVCLQKHWGLLLVKGLERFITVEDFDGITDGVDLCQAIFDTLVIVGIHGCTLLLQALQECCVVCQLLLRVFKLLGFSCKVLLGLCNICINLNNQLLSCCHFILLCSLERLVLFLGLRLSLLGFAQVDFKIFLHLTKDAENLAALRRIALHAWDGQERCGALCIVQERAENLDLCLADTGIDDLSQAGIEHLVSNSAHLSKRRIVLAQD